jgi:hypothetical protein
VIGKRSARSFGGFGFDFRRESGGQLELLADQRQPFAQQAMAIADRAYLLRAARQNRSFCVENCAKSHEITLNRVRRRIGISGAVEGPQSR